MQSQTKSVSLATEPVKLCLFDPGLQRNDGTPSSNLGDLIIQEAVVRELTGTFGRNEILHISTHTFPEPEHIHAARRCSLSFVGGTNLLSSELARDRHWQFSLKRQIRLKGSILLGVGWQKYQGKPNLQTSLFLKLLLSRNLLHSVRDSYTKAQLQGAGIRNVLNTGCPTMWTLAAIPPDDIPMHKAKNALVMLTDYDPNPDLDRKLLQLICSKYNKVFVWLQGKEDGAYLSTLVPELSSSLSVIEHSYDAFKQFLASGISFDYIGTRLHGGVKCLVNRHRSLVISIDNRAAEIAKDTNLPTANRGDFDLITRWIDTPSPTRITLNLDAIERWRSQFQLFKRGRC